MSHDPAEAVDVDAETFRSWDGKSQRRVVREAVGFHTYAPPEESSIQPGDCEAYNPGLDAYLETHQWSSKGWRPIDDTRPYRSAPAYLPSEEGIRTLADLQLVEVGAGSGYWAHVVNRAGGDVVPTDLRPPEIDDGAEPPATTEYVHVTDDGKRNVHHETLWADVETTDHRVLEEHQHRDVLLCHPPVDEFAEEVLDLVGEGQRLALVAEWYPGVDATPLFYRRLRENWELEETFPVYDWASMHARGYVFSRA